MYVCPLKSRKWLDQMFHNFSDKICIGEGNDFKKTWNRFNGVFLLQSTKGAQPLSYFYHKYYLYNSRLEF